MVLNDAAQQVIESVKGKHATYVFTYRGKPIQRMNNSAWHRARKKAGLKHVRVHDLKHTFGRRLRAAGVSLEDRADLLGHKTGRMTTHYSAAELDNLIQAANSVCNREKSGVLLRAFPQQVFPLAQIGIRTAQPEGQVLNVPKGGMQESVPQKSRKLV